MTLRFLGFLTLLLVNELVIGAPVFFDDDTASHYDHDRVGKLAGRTLMSIPEISYSVQGISGVCVRQETRKGRSRAAAISSFLMDPILTMVWIK